MNDSVFFYGSGMYRKHPIHTYGRNRNDSANNRANGMTTFDLKIAVKLSYCGSRDLFRFFDSDVSRVLAVLAVQMA